MSFPLLSRPASDWLISATDPFHDFEHPIEGAPDRCVSKSYTRKYSQQATVSATADDDNIAVYFTGYHGDQEMQFYNWGTDLLCDVATVTANQLCRPGCIHVIRSAAAARPTLINVPTGVGTASLLTSFHTTQDGSIPSRLCSLGIEITDVTPSLVRKGTIYVSHTNGDHQIGVFTRQALDAAGDPADYIYQGICWQPVLPVTGAELVATPGSYVGPAAKGAYVVARLNEIQPPNMHWKIFPDNSGAGTGTPVSTINYVYPTGAARAETMVSCQSFAAGSAEAYRLLTAPGWSPSGFLPFTIKLSGVDASSTFQIVVKATVEYFPQVTHLFQTGLATYSPNYEPLAFTMYHEAMKRIPAAVPVSMNPAGEYWQMVKKSLSQVHSALRSSIPWVGQGLEVAGLLSGDPILSGAGKAVTTIARLTGNKPGSGKKQPAKQQPPKKGKKKQ